MKKTAVASVVLVGVVAMQTGCGRQAPPTAAVPPAPAPAAPAVPTAAPPAPAPAWPFVGQNTPGAIRTDDYLRRNYYFVLDGSGSMRDIKCSGSQPKMDVAKAALLKFIDKVPADANVGGLVFDVRGIRELAPLAPKAAADWPQLINGIRADGGTPLRSAISSGYRALTARAAAQLGYGEYHLVVVTDGEANQGEDPREAVNRLTSTSPIVLHTIGFCIGESHSLNQPGKVVYRAADNAEALDSGLAEVLAEAPRFDVTAFKKQ